MNISSVAKEPFFVWPDELRQLDFELPEVTRLPIPRLEEEWAKALASEDMTVADWERLAIQSFLVESFEKALEAVDRMTSGQEATEAGHWVQALAREATGQYLLALESWYALQQAQPDNPLPGLRMALCWLALDRPDAAIQQLVWHVPRHPGDVRATHLLAALYFRQQQPQRAWRLLARVASQTELTDSALLFLIWLTVQDGQYHEAIGWLRRLLDRHPPDLQHVWVRLPEFEPLQQSALYTDLCAEYGLDPTAVFDPAHVQPLPTRQVVTLESVRSGAVLPPSLNVIMQLQRGEEEADPEEKLTTGLRLRMPVAEPTEEEIRLDFMSP